MYTDQKRHYQIVLVAAIVMLVLALLVTSGALAKSDKPDKGKHDHPNNGQVTVPHKDKAEKQMRVNCHSQHAVEAGVGCRKAKPDAPRPATTPDSQPDNNVVKIRKPAETLFPSLNTIMGGGGGGVHSHVVM